MGGRIHSVDIVELMEHMTAAVALYEPVDDGTDFIFLDINPAGERIESVRKPDILGRRVTEVFPGVEDFGLLDVFRRVHLTGEPTDHPIRHYSDDRINGWRENHVFRAGDGTIVAVYEDRTLDKRKEMKLLEMNRTLQALIESSPIPIVIFDREGLIRMWNPACERLFGMKEAEVLGSVSTTFSTELVGNFWEQLVGMTEGRGYVTWEGYLRGSSDRRIYASLSLAPLIGKDGDIHGVTGMIMDLTERHRTEEVLRESEEKVTRILESSPDPMVVTSPEHVIISTNTAMLRLVDVSDPGGLLGCSLLEFMVDDELERARLLLDKVMVSGGCGNEPFTVVRSDGLQIPAEVSLSTLDGSDGTPSAYVYSVKDISRRVENERIIRQSAVEKELLLKELQHRVKNNLQLMSSVVDMQVMREPDDEVRRSMENIQSIIHTMALIHTRVYMERSLGGIELNQFVQDLMNDLRSLQLRRDLSLRYDVTGDPVRLGMNDAIPVSLILNEVLFNTIKHGYPDRESGIISIMISEDSGVVTITVRDDGTGFPKGFDQVSIGSFGLQMVKNLVDQVHGEIHMVNDGGAMTILSFPLDSTSTRSSFE